MLTIACSLRGASQTDSIGGLIMRPGVPGEVLPDERRAWEALSATDARLAAFLDAPPLRREQEQRDLRRRARALESLQDALLDVCALGQARPAVAALVRLGQVQEEMDRWLLAASDGGQAHSGTCPPERIHRQRALEADVVAVEIGHASRLHGDPSLQLAAARAGALDPTVDFAPPLEERP